MRLQSMVQSLRTKEPQTHALKPNRCAPLPHRGANAGAGWCSSRSGLAEEPLARERVHVARPHESGHERRFLRADPPLD